MPRRIGIMGGTFDPIHIGHLIMAESACMALALEKVIFMPSGNPPHKAGRTITDFAIRSDMVKLSIDNNKNFVYSDFETRREGYVYTSDTLKLLKEQYPDITFYFIVGADSLLKIENWHEPENVFKRCRLVVADRDDQEDKVKARIRYLEEKYHADIVYLRSPLVDISSTLIRERVCKGQSVKYLVTTEVEEYIVAHGLYQ